MTLECRKEIPHDAGEAGQTEVLPQIQVPRGTRETDRLDALSEIGEAGWRGRACHTHHENNLLVAVFVEIWSGVGE